METQLEAQSIVLQELGDVDTASVWSFGEALEIVESNEAENKALALRGTLKYDEDEDEMRALELLPEAFDLNTAMQKLEFYNFEVDHILVAEVLRAGVKNNNITCVGFWSCEKVNNQRLMKTMCEGFRERSTGIQLVLSNCSSYFVQPIIEASCLKCFSLNVAFMSCLDRYDLKHSLRNIFLKSNLYYISLRYIIGLKEDIFIQLVRCLPPKLAKLDLLGTEVPTAALKRLSGSLNLCLNSGRSNAFQVLDLTSTVVDEKLAFAYFRLLRSDLVEKFCLRIEEGISRAAVKSFSSTVTKTKNLKYLVIREGFSSGTKFNNFKLQNESTYFYYPFQVNPTAV